MKGWELLKVLRDRGRQVPVVLVSVLDGVDEKVRALDLGADDYIVKPCSFDELLLRLHAVLRRIRGRTGVRWAIWTSTCCSGACARTGGPST